MSNNNNNQRFVIKHPKLATFFEVLNFLSLIALAIILIMIVWNKEEQQINFLIKLSISDFIVFLVTLILYRLCCYSTTND